ncbi:acyl-CoA dehydrogenase family protein [Kitasatospora sp. NPDC056783]|uniref:acyl-CoA dehydrogenase family protein n=1 Tax=Kitasatospora sp. NPDC056783 TaxID=3345943 RepID=UPI003675568C
MAVGTAQRLEAGGDVTVDPAIAKLLASESGLAASQAAVQVLGGNGCMSEYGLEKDVRDAVAGTGRSGSNETRYDRVAAVLGLGR